MLQIDCSQFNEAGGQILRTALGLSALTQQEVTISNIRAGRSVPGLQPQHLASVKTIAQICAANFEDATLHSKQLTFRPGKLSPAQLNVNIGTAGSLGLMLQQLLPIALAEQVQLRAQGGTHVPFAPSIHFLQQVLFPQLKKMGLNVSLEQTQFGFYPKGNGRIFFESKPTKLPLKSVHLTKLGKLEQIICISACSGLPRDIAVAQARAAEKFLKSKWLDAHFEFVETIAATPTRTDTIGTSIDLFACFDSGAVLAGTALGEKGKPAEHVGQQAAKHLFDQISSGQACDVHLADQLIPFCALAQGTSELQVTQISQHCLTNIEVVKQFLPQVEIEVQGTLGKPGAIKIKGIGFKLD